MQVKRAIVDNSVLNNWCSICQRYSLRRDPTGMPGIVGKRCTSCNGRFIANTLESENDMLEIDDYHVFLRLDEDR